MLTFILLLLLVFVLSLCTMAIFEACNAVQDIREATKLFISNILIAFVGSLFFGFGCLRATSSHGILAYVLWVLLTFFLEELICHIFALFALLLFKFF